MGFVDTTLANNRPDSVNTVSLPRRTKYFGSPLDWRDEVIYFMLPDRFSDGGEAARPLLDPANPAARRPAGMQWSDWANSGSGRFQGGTLRGLTSKLDYIKSLGATTLWVGPVWKQRTHWDSYHGYAIQDFLEIDPRFGNRKDLVDLISAAHQRGMRILLDIVFNHTSNNWIYASGDDQPNYLPWPNFYAKGNWRTRTGAFNANVQGPDDGVWPNEFQRDDYYTRAGEGNLGAGGIDDPHAEFRRTDFVGDRDINYDGTTALTDVLLCYKYWIALTDCDGFRIDTLKHVDEDTGRNFCGSVKEFAANLGKLNFFLVGEVAGDDTNADRYLEVLGSNLDATLDIGQTRLALTAVAKGLSAPNTYFDLLKIWNDELGSNRNSGRRRVSVLDDHDHVYGVKLRFSAGASNDHQVVAGVAIQLFSLGIPCIYYGTEQSFAGPEASQQKWLPDWGGNADRYLRECMFGPDHPRKSGLDGLAAGAAGFDPALPGFGAFGTTGAHCFNPNAAAYVRIAGLIPVRNAYPVLRYGRQYQRQTSNFGAPFALPGPGELIAWSRILDDEEALCIVNGHGTQSRGADVLVDANLNAASAAGKPWGNSAPFLTVVANSAQTAVGAAYAGTHPVGEKLAVQSRDGSLFVSLRNVQPSEVVVLSNRP
jgi:glycosidase